MILLPLVIFSVGTAIWFFMTTLNQIVSIFQSNWIYLLAGLPLLAISVAYLENVRKWTCFGSTKTLIEEIRNPQKHVHWLLAPWITVLTLLFHLFGASVGRESTAIQMGGSLAETLGRFLRIAVEDRPILIRMGLSAGFGAAFGVPWAGTVFGIESPLIFRKRDWLHLPFYLLSSWGSYHWARFLGLDHILWQNLSVNFWELSWPSYSQLVFFLILLAMAYEFLFRKTYQQLNRIPWWMKSGISGLLLLLLTFWVGSPVFNNLGINLIESSFMQTSSFFQALGKLGFTFVSTVTGMKGGEVTPLMSAGALFGSWFAGAHSTLNFQIGAAIGLVVLFCSRLRIPFTGILMLGEFFDWRVAVLGAPILLLIEASQRMTFDRTDLKSEPKEI